MHPIPPLLVRVPIILGLLCASALAGLTDPVSYGIVSAGQDRILIVQSPIAETQDNRTPVVLASGLSLDPRTSFPSTGVYELPDLKPVWTSAFYCFEHEIRTSGDFSNVVILKTKGYTDPDSLLFLQNGAPVSAHAAKDLLLHFSALLLLPYSTWDWHIRWYEDLSGIDAGKITLQTARRSFHAFGFEVPLGYDETYVFDVETGAILSEKTNWGYLPSAAGAVLIILAALGIVLFVSRKSPGR